MHLLSMIMGSEEATSKADGYNFTRIKFYGGYANKKELDKDCSV